MKNLSEKQIGLVLFGAIALGLAAGWLFNPAPSPVPESPGETIKWRLPAVAKEWSATQSARTLITRAPWGADEEDPATQSGAEGDSVSDGNSEAAEALAAAVAQWRFLGSVRRGNRRYGFFLDENDEPVRVAVGERLDDRLELVELGSGTATLRDAGDQSSLEVELFRTTTFEIETESAAQPEAEVPFTPLPVPDNGESAR